MDDGNRCLSMDWVPITVRIRSGGGALTALFGYRSLDVTDSTVFRCFT